MSEIKTSPLPLHSTQLKYNEQGLIPAVVTDASTKELLMMGYMNKEAVDLTLELKEAVFYSRSQQKLWHKGITSGNVLKIVHINADCDADCLQLEVKVLGDGVACHTGTRSCFFRSLSY